MQLRAVALKREIEEKLAGRIPAALSPIAQQAPRLHPSGNSQIDALIGGGYPLGSICELTGADGSGRTSIALSLVAEGSAEGACAYVDVSDNFSPHSAAAAGVHLRNLLWVRFAVGIERSIAHAVQPPTLPEPKPRARESVQQNCGGPHPRGETKGLAPALQDMLVQSQERRRTKMEGTPGYPNQPIGLGQASAEQLEWESFNVRRPDEQNRFKQLDRASADAARQRAATGIALASRPTRQQKPWSLIDRALRATDQILQAGGFRIVVLDLGSLPVEHAFKIQAATWWRFQKAAQQGDAILLLVTREPCARSSAACVLECKPNSSFAIQGVLTGATHAVEVSRQRTGPAFGRKAPGRATVWDSSSAWMRAVGN